MPCRNAAFELSKARIRLEGNSMQSELDEWTPIPRLEHNLKELLGSRRIFSIIDLSHEWSESERISSRPFRTDQRGLLQCLYFDSSPMN
jgi:hypothetical protein